MKRQFRPTDNSCALEEALQYPPRQKLSLSLALAAAVVSMFSLREPSACVKYSQEQAIIPMKCEALKDYHQTASVHLQPFCYTNCSDGSLYIYTCALIFGLLLQTIVISPACCGCGGFLRVTFSFNYTGKVDMVKESTERYGGWLAMLYDHESLVKKLQKLQQLRSSRLPLPMRLIHTFAVRLYMLAFLELVIHGLSNLHLYHHGVHFTCTGQSGEEIKSFGTVQYRSRQVIGQLMICVLLALSISSARAKWQISFECKLGDLRKAMRDAHGRASTICHETEHLKLSQVNGKELVQVLRIQDMRLRDPRCWSDNIIIERPGDNPDANTEVVFARPKDSEEKKRRKTLLKLVALGIVFLHSASASCWSCINNVDLTESQGSLFDIQAKIILLGSCGRHTGSGLLCLLGACCLVVVAVAQAVIIKAKNDEDTPDKEMRFTRTVKKTNDDPVCSSHVWLRESTSNDWTPADGSRNQSERSRWRRSEDLLKVCVIPRGRAAAGVNPEGLPTDLEGEADTYIEFQLDGRVVHQVVPLHFLDGNAFLSLNVGSQRAWDRFALFASTVALALVLLDLISHGIYSFEGDLLQNCGDIISGGCLMLDNLVYDQVPSTSAIGVMYASLGALLAASISLMLAIWPLRPTTSRL